MRRVPASLALLALRQSSHEISPSTLRMWVNRGHITRGTGGYDLTEIAAYLDRRGGRTSRDQRSSPNATPRPSDFPIMPRCTSDPDVDIHRPTAYKSDDTNSSNASVAVGAPHFATIAGTPDVAAHNNLGK